MNSPLYFLPGPLGWVQPTGTNPGVPDIEKSLSSGSSIPGNARGVPVARNVPGATLPNHENEMRKIP